MPSKSNIANAEARERRKEKAAARIKTNFANATASNLRRVTQKARKAGISKPLQQLRKKWARTIQAARANDTAVAAAAAKTRKSVSKKIRSGEVTVTFLNGRTKKAKNVVDDEEFDVRPDEWAKVQHYRINSRN